MNFINVTWNVPKKYCVKIFHFWIRCCPCVCIREVSLADICQMSVLQIWLYYMSALHCIIVLNARGVYMY